MTKHASRLLAAAMAVGVVGGGLVFRPASTLAGPFGGSLALPDSLSVVAYPPDGGADINIISSVRLDTTASTAPGTYLAVAGDTTGSTLRVDSTGSTVSLSSGTLASINGRTCSLGGQDREGIDGTARHVPPLLPDGGSGGMVGRTSIALTYHGTTGHLSCYASGFATGTNPTCTLPTAGAAQTGWFLDPGSSVALEVSAAYEMKCISCTVGGSPSGSTQPVSYVETACSTP